MPVIKERSRRYVLNNDLFSTLMKARGWDSLAASARALGIHHSTLARMHAHKSSPSYSLAMRLAEELEVPHNALFVEEES